MIFLVVYAGGVVGSLAVAAALCRSAKSGDQFAGREERPAPTTELEKSTQ